MMKKIIIFLFVLSVFKCLGQSTGQTTSYVLSWRDYFSILHNDFKVADSILISKNFIHQGINSYYLQEREGVNIKLNVSNDGAIVKSIAFETNDSAYSDKIYEEIINYLKLNKIEALSSPGNDFVYYEYKRLFRVYFKSFKYSHYGINVSSD